jgi:HK97 family phage major capsid protein
MAMLDLRTETQILSGSGVSPELKGINNTAGINTQAKGADSVPDCFYKLITKIRTLGFAEPDLIIINPNDWVDVRLLKTADGVYIWGNPSEEGPERMWGKPVLVTTAQPENTGLTGEFQTYSAVYTKGGVEVRTVDTDGDDFKFNRLATRIERRAAVVLFRLLAFGQATGI